MLKRPGIQKKAKHKKTADGRTANEVNELKTTAAHPKGRI